MQLIWNHNTPRALREVCKQVGKRMKKGAMVGIESTVAPRNKREHRQTNT